MKAYGLSTLFLQEKPIIKMLGFKILFRENAFLSPEENASGALFTCIFLSLFSNPHPPTPWHPSTEYSLGRSPYLDQILFLPLLHDVTWSKCLNLSEPWLLNFCITMLNNIHWHDCEAEGSVNTVCESTHQTGPHVLNAAYISDSLIKR